MDIQKNVPLTQYTSFGVGGVAENFIEAHNLEQLTNILKSTDIDPIHPLGYGTNTLISDKTITGLVVRIVGGSIDFTDNNVVIDAGASWDDVVLESIKRNLWGIEFMSKIPGSVGPAVYINIAAYGQTIGPLVQWVDVWDRNVNQIRRIEKSELSWDYKWSIFQKPENRNLVILRTAIALSHDKTDALTYQKAVDVAEELGLSVDTLENRRIIITETRKRAGSLWYPHEKTPRTAGSFFRNPLVDERLAEQIVAYDETGKTIEQIKLMNQIHGGTNKRVSAAHVMLAAGFRRGQQWGNVKLNDQNLLKIEALPGANAQEIYNVGILIQKTCAEKLGIKLEPETQFLGDFR